MSGVSTPELIRRMLSAVACGAIIGLNRDLHHKSAGFRTFGLVSLGGALVTLIIVQASDGDASAFSRVMQGVLTGVGFLGAGVIFHQLGSHQATTTQVTGLTTAAAIWLTAGLGIACGAGLYLLALVCLGLTLLVLMIGKKIERFFENWAGSSRQCGTKERHAQVSDSDDGKESSD